MKKFYRTSPCSNCPFRNDESGIKGLGKERAEDIALQIERDGFVCHKTVDYSKDEGELDPQRRQCAGAMILSQKIGKTSPFIQLHERLVGPLKLEGRELIVNTIEEFVKNQE